MQSTQHIKRAAIRGGIILLLVTAIGCGSGNPAGPSDEYSDSGYDIYSNGYGGQSDGSGSSYYYDPVNNYSVTSNNGEVSAYQGPQYPGTDQETGSTSAFRGSDGTFYITNSVPPPGCE